MDTTNTKKLGETQRSVRVARLDRERTEQAAQEDALALAERLASGAEPATGEAALKLAALVRAALGGEG